MKLIVCIDDGNGITFNHRRVTKDKELVKEIVKIVGDSKLYLSPYSKELFEGYSLNLQVMPNVYSEAQENDYCFLEDVPLDKYTDSVSEVYLVKWNRIYPSDVKFSMDLYLYKMISSFDIKGYSHEKITIEHYIKGEVWDE